MKWHVPVLTIVAAAALTAAAPRAPTPSACRVPGLSLPARCGTLDVREGAASARTIAMRYIVVPAVRRNAGAVFVILGGPGQAAAADIAVFLGGSSPFTSMLGIHADHDLVFADQRGTGGSHPLNCPNLYASRTESFAEIYPSAPLRRCREKLAATSDLNAYGTRQAVDDLEALRKALGYDNISIDTGSYGSQVAFEYLRRYPSSLRAVLLEAVAPTYAKIPLPFTRAAQRALDELEGSCARDAACARAYPDFSSEWSAVNDRFIHGPQRISFHDGHTTTTVMLSREVFADNVRHLLYDPFFAAALPAAIHAAARDDYGPLAKLIAAQIDGFKNELAYGMFFSVSCSEDVAFISAADRAMASRQGFLSDLRIRAQQRACAIWNVRRAPASWMLPVRSKVPVLMISGADDPAAPAWLGASQLPYLADARQLIVANGGHNNEDACLAQIRIAFIDRPDPKAARQTCAQRFTRPPFVTDFDPWYRKFF